MAPSSFDVDKTVKRLLPCFSFTRDSFWSWVLVGVAFLNNALNIGIMSTLGSFFDSWKAEFSRDFGYDSSRYARIDVMEMETWSNRNGLIKNNSNYNTIENISRNNIAVISDATLTWIQSCAFSLCYLSSPLANAALHQFPARLVMVSVSVALCSAFLLAAYEGRSLID